MAARIEVDLDAIAATYAATRSMLKVAEVHNISASTARLRLLAAGVNLNGNETPLDEAAVAAFYSSSGNISATAREFRVCRQKIRAVLDATGVAHTSRIRRPDVDAQDVLASYKKTRSVVLTADELRCSPITVCRRLESVGVARSDYRHWTETELERLRQDYWVYRCLGKLAALAEELDRPLSTTMLKAAELGLTSATGPRRYLETWQAMSDMEIRELFARFKASGLTVDQFATRENISRDGFSRLMRERIPGEWTTARQQRARNGETAYSAGVNVEYEVVNHLRKRGFDCYVSPGSQSPTDVMAIGPDGTLYAIQSKRSGRLAPSEWNALLEHAAKTASVPLLAANPSGRSGEVAFWRLTGPKQPGIKHHAQPRERVEFTATGTLAPTAAAA